MFKLRSNIIRPSLLVLIIGLGWIDPTCTKAPAAGESAAPGDIFSTPDTTQTRPTFAGRIQTDVSALNSKPPDRESLLSIPSITNDQKKQVTKIFEAQKDQIQPLQGEIESLQRILKNKKSTKLPSLSFSAPPPAPDLLNRNTMAGPEFMPAPDLQAHATSFTDDSEESVKARIESLRQAITNVENQTWLNVRSAVSQQQLNELAEMKNGQLFIVSNSNPDQPQPPIKPAPSPRAPNQAPHQIPAPYRPTLLPGLALPGYHPIANPVISTTKQLLYRTLLRL